MNSPSFGIANKKRVTSLRRIDLILQKSNGLLLAHIARAWGTGGVTKVPYGGAMIESETSPVGQGNESEWQDTDDVTH